MAHCIPFPVDLFKHEIDIPKNCEVELLIDSEVVEAVFKLVESKTSKFKMILNEVLNARYRNKLFEHYKWTSPSESVAAMKFIAYGGGNNHRIYCKEYHSKCQPYQKSKCKKVVLVEVNPHKDQLEVPTSDINRIGKYHLENH